MADKDIDTSHVRGSYERLWIKTKKSFKKEEDLIPPTHEIFSIATLEKFCVNHSLH